jgi:hypothetical protein
VGVFGAPVVESENDVAILLDFNEVDVWTIGNEECGEMGIIRDAFIEESFLVGGPSVGLVFIEDKDARNKIRFCVRVEDRGDWGGEVNQVVGKQFQVCRVYQRFRFSERFRDVCGGV